MVALAGVWGREGRFRKGTCWHHEPLALKFVSGHSCSQSSARAPHWTGLREPTQFVRIPLVLAAKQPGNAKAVSTSFPLIGGQWALAVITPRWTLPAGARLRPHWPRRLHVVLGSCSVAL